MLSSVLDVLTTLVSCMITYASEIVAFVMEQPLILMFVVVGLVGIGVGLIRRLIRL